MYALIAQDADQDKLDRFLDEPLPSELTPEERKRAEMRRIADANRAAMEGLRRTQGMQRP